MLFPEKGKDKCKKAGLLTNILRSGVGPRDRIICTHAWVSKDSSFPRYLFKIYHSETVHSTRIQSFQFRFLLFRFRPLKVLLDPFNTKIWSFCTSSSFSSCSSTVLSLLCFTLLNFTSTVCKFGLLFIAPKEMSFLRNKIYTRQDSGESGKWWNRDRAGSLRKNPRNLDRKKGSAKMGETTNFPWKQARKESKTERNKKM